MQVLYVNLALQYGQLRAANRAVKAFSLQEQYPDVERLYRAQQLAKLAGKGLWGVRSRSSCPAAQATLVVTTHLLCSTSSLLWLNAYPAHHPPRTRCRWRRSMRARSASCSAAW